ncbi:uncharacterized protein EV420DRAFT_1649812 [Desarmillaria tabescens]|uniref:Protein kinase domain-containing protein n=1 Tax=Armillaria tabescens TaxID=1929756 RepID=A0AA39MPM5_ARMTA|nr:uncharacterized protein EV420DRAFT_1649812 [Desarmillaria tabescens]KAK0442007.1 hypothetical protein EV420DRAFT_1649812 [Desarmillaria tabescens]
MPHNFNIDACIQIAKLAAAAGEIASFPYLKGMAGCVVVFLEVIQKAAQNDEDLKMLAAYPGETSALHFQNICTELEMYLGTLLTELHTTQNRLNSERIRRFFKTKKVSDAINEYKERVNNAKANFRMNVAMDSRLALSVATEELNTNIKAVSGAVKKSEQTIISTIKTHTDGIYEEIHTLGVRQGERDGQLYTTAIPSKYQGHVSEFIPSNIYLEKPVESFGKFSDYESFQDFQAIIMPHGTQSIVCQYCKGDKQALQWFHKDLDSLLCLKHPNVMQIYGVCTTAEFLAIVFHGDTRISVDDYFAKSTSQEVMIFYAQAYFDFKSIFSYLDKNCIVVSEDSIAEGK